MIERFLAKSGGKTALKEDVFAFYLLTDSFDHCTNLLVRSALCQALCLGPGCKGTHGHLSVSRVACRLAVRQKVPLGVSHGVGVVLLKNGGLSSYWRMKYSWQCQGGWKS